MALLPNNFVSSYIFVVFIIATSISASKIEFQLKQHFKHETTANIFVTFVGGNKLAIESTKSVKFESRTKKINYLVSSLKFLSTKSQRNVVNALPKQHQSVEFKQFWATNEIFIRGATTELLTQLALVPEIETIRKERSFTLEPLQYFDEATLGTESRLLNEVEWNIEKIEATQAWQLPGGNNGQNVVVANIDTGVRHTHETLRNNFRENYGWFDALRGNEIPYDNGGHGTHTMGSLAGSGGIGVAPGAQWIACKGCGGVFCGEETLKDCGQWMLCPTLPNGESPDCSKAPHIVSNSWGGGNEDSYDAIIDAWRAADIIPFFSIGNSGPDCETTGAPGNNVNVIGVGSTTSNDAISGSSAAGPSPTGLLKPDISAPGHLIRSAFSTNDTEYMISSGTSMACPHAAGVAALLLSQNPKLTFTEVKQLLEINAERDLLGDTGRTCGGIPSTRFPNNQYGHGRLNARMALAAAISA